MSNYRPRGLLHEWQERQQGRHSVATVTNRVRYVQRFQEWLVKRDGLNPQTDEEYDAVLLAASTRDIDGWLGALASGEAGGKLGEGVTVNTRATYISAIKAFSRWLVLHEYRDDNPCERLERLTVKRGQPRPVSDRELTAILAVNVRRRTRMMLLLAAFQGLRCFEIAKIKGQDVNLHDRKLRVIGKGRVDATLPLHPLVADFAAEADFPTKGFWFPTHVGNRNTEAGPILAKSVSHELSLVFERAGVEGGAHRLRHWHATSMLNKGKDVRVVQTLMRHADLSTTALYTKVDPTKQVDALESLDLPESRSA